MLSIHNEKEVTPDDIITEANVAWKKVRASGAPADELLNMLHREHKDLSMSYAIVIRYMCDAREYSPAALRRYLNYLAKNPPKSTDAYLEAQAEYVVFLYKEFHRHYRSADVMHLRIGVRAALKKEHDDFMATHERLSKVLDDKETRLLEKSREELKKFLADHAAAGNSAVDYETKIVSDVRADIAGRPAADQPAVSAPEPAADQPPMKLSDLLR